MAPPKPYPRSTLKRIIHANSGLKVSKNADVLIYLDYVVFMQQLLREANLHARLANDGGNGKKVAVTARDVRKVSQVMLRRFKG